jgi:hypothetical protein
MKLSDLKLQIDRIIEADPDAGKADVVFGPSEGEHVFLRGGIYGRSKREGEANRLILADIKLNAVGGF